MWHAWLEWLAIIAAGSASPGAVSQLAPCSPSRPPVWPLRFRALQRKVPASDPGCTGGTCATTTTYYDWERQANLIVIRPDAAAVSDGSSDALWDLELGNHNSYYFHPSTKQCRFIHFDVGILRPDWLAGANYTGESVIHGRKVLGWTKADFIDYYADASDCTPVRWFFHTMQAAFDTIGFFEGETVPDSSFFTPPSYCPNRTEHREHFGQLQSVGLMLV